MRPSPAFGTLSTGLAFVPTTLTRRCRGTLSRSGGRGTCEWARDRAWEFFEWLNPRLKPWAIAGRLCKDPQNPRRHGPYYKVSYVYRGRFSSRFIPPDQAKAVRMELANYKRLRELTEKWVGLSLCLAKEKRRLSA